MGEVITFYSFKGGVGRTMALANVATLLSQWDYKVLMVDWDLHAPGLEYFFQDYIADFDPETGLQQEGILDLIEKVEIGELNSSELPNLEDMIIPINVPKGKTPLHLITAGKRDDRYFKKVSQLDLGEFYAQKDGGEFIENLRSHWKEIYDFVLIDSRTGISDVGGICTIQLPDVLVVFLTATAQSLKGTLDVFRKATTARQHLPVDRLNLLTLAVPTRFDGQVRASMPEEWLQKFVSKLSPLYENWLPPAVDRLDFLRTIRIPYTPHYSFGERQPVLEEEIKKDPGDINEAYENLTALIANKLKAAEDLLENRGKYIYWASKPYAVFLSYNSEDLEHVEKIARYLKEHAHLRPWFERWEMNPGKSRIENLSHGLSISATCVFFVGKSSQSPWQQAEIEIALRNQLQDQEFRVIPVLLPDAPKQLKFPSFLAGITWVAFQEGLDDDDALWRLECGIRGVSPGRLKIDASTKEDTQRSITAGRDYFEQIAGNVTVHTGGDYFEQIAGDVTAHYFITSPSTDPIALREVYLNLLFKQVSQISLVGIDRKAASHDVEACLNLAENYTALLTLNGESALMQLNQHRRLVLLGDPGSGKSTFVNFVAMCLAGELLGIPDTNLTLLTAPLPMNTGEDADEPQSWEHGALLPILVNLRDFATKGLPPGGQRATAKDIWNFISVNLEEVMLGDYTPYLQQQLREYGVLLLLDGLDEAPEAEQRRTQIKQAIEDFARVFPKCLILLTSRSYAYQNQDWRLAGFAEAVLAPFSPGQIRRFVDQWYRLMAEMRGLDVENAQGRAELLKRAIFSSNRLYSFAQRPLLLTLMASLHAWRGGSLPEKREELYADIVDLLLDWWERSKILRDKDGQIITIQPSLTEFLKISKTSLQQTLNRLAFSAHTIQSDFTGTADIPEQELIIALMRISRNPDLRPIRLIEFLNNRTGLLVQRGVGVYAFSHRTLQEYLTACYFTEQQDYPDNIAELARRDPNRWREIMLLAAAKAARGSASSRWALAEALCYKDIVGLFIKAPPEDAWGALLAGQVLVENADLTQISPRNQPKVERIQSWLVAIMTEQVISNTPFPVVERALAGNLLAVLGDPRPGIGLWKDGLSDIVWYDIPAGLFLMGSDPGKDQNLYDQELPQHEVFTPAYRISRYPITNAQYLAFVEDDGYTKKWRDCWTYEGWELKEQANITGSANFGGTFDLANHPVVGISWHEATAYCQWLTIRLRKTGELSEDVIIRLPTEAEWEKAARGQDGRIYPWGNEITSEHANYTDTGLGVTSTVGCFPRGVSPYGCEDMAGNVWEWCLDPWHESYEDAPTDGSGWITGGDESFRVLRGGAWESDFRHCRCAIRYRNSPTSRLSNIGFRLVLVKTRL